MSSYFANDEESTTTTTNNTQNDDDDNILEHYPIVIVGGGIGGLVLALCLDQVYNHPTTTTTTTALNEQRQHQQDGSSSTTTTKRRHLPIHVYESTSAYTNNAGGAIGLYSNGLRVLKHLSKTHPELSDILFNVRNAGCDYIYRRWMRHDGLEVAVAREDELLSADADDVTEEFVMCHGDNNNTDNEEVEDLGAQPRRITEVNEKSSSSSFDDDDEDGEVVVQTMTNDGPSRRGDFIISSTTPRRRRSTIESENPSLRTSNHSQRPRGDLIAESQDKEGERADRRPRGGSIGSLQHAIQSLSKRNLLGSNASARSLVSNSSAAADNVVIDGGNNKNDTNNNNGGEVGGRPRSNSGRSMRDLLQSLGSSAKDITATVLGERISGISTATAAATTSSTNNSNNNTPARVVDSELLSLGIRRWKYQEVLYNACVAAGVHVHFGKRLQSVTSIISSTNDNNNKDDDLNNKTLLQFKDGTQITTSLLIGADGVNSKVRNYVIANSSTRSDGSTTSSSELNEDWVPEYTGTTCLMGCANVPRPVRGICFPSSATTKCHACYYPTHVPKEEEDIDSSHNKNNTTNTADRKDDDNNEHEMVFQIYFPTPIERPDTWRTLTPQEAKDEARELACMLRKDGWDEQFLEPLESDTLTGVLRVGLRSREALDCWHVGGDGTKEGTSLGRAVLLGDAAHPPVPYIGQGAQMAMEDAGTLSVLLGHFCPMNDSTPDDNDATTASLDLTQFSKAMSVYESLRVSRTKAVLGSSVALGKTQQKRAESKLYNAWRELSIKTQVWAYGTLPVMRPGAAFDYRAAVEEALLGVAEEEKEE